MIQEAWFQSEHCLKVLKLEQEHNVLEPHFPHIKQEYFLLHPIHTILVRYTLSNTKYKESLNADSLTYISKKVGVGRRL